MTVEAVQTSPSSPRVGNGLGGPERARLDRKGSGSNVGGGARVGRLVEEEMRHRGDPGGSPSRDESHIKRKSEEGADVMDIERDGRVADSKRKR